MDELEKQLSEKQHEMEKLRAEINNLEQRKMEQIPVTRKEFEEFKSEIRTLMAGLLLERKVVTSNPLPYSMKPWFTGSRPYNYSVNDYGESTSIAQ